MLAGSPRRTVTVVTAGSVQTPSLQARRRGAMIFRLLKVNTQKENKTKRQNQLRKISHFRACFDPHLSRTEPNKRIADNRQPVRAYSEWFQLKANLTGGSPFKFPSLLIRARVSYFDTSFGFRKGKHTLKESCPIARAKVS